MNNKRFFNTAGPVNCDKHYCLSPLERVKLEEILPLIEQEKYFVLHAPRQTGKTSCLLALRDCQNESQEYRGTHFPDFIPALSWIAQLYQGAKGRGRCAEKTHDEKIRLPRGS